MAIVIGYVFITPFVRRMGLPSAIGISLAVLLVLVPLESGILLWQGKKRNGRFSLDGIVLNRKRDLRIGVASHWLLNTLGSLELLMAVFR